MNFKSIGISAAFVALAGAAAYPHIEAYRKSLPVQMTKEQAGERYLRTICPVNSVVDKINEVEKKMEEEGKKKYWPGSDELANANARMGALNNNRISLGHRYAETLEQTAKKLNDPKFIWPKEVRDLVPTYADTLYAQAGAMRLVLKGQEPEKVKEGNYSDKIRLRLDLPSRGVCPTKYTK